MRQHYPPGRGEGRSPRRPQRVTGPQPVPDQTQCNASRTTSPERIIRRAQVVVDMAALLAFDLAALAARTGRGDYAAAALHLLDATTAAWLASETLAEGAAR